VAHFGDQFRLTLITNDPVLAAKGDAAGVDRIGLDLERLGKAERQAGHKARFSDHKMEDLAAIARALGSAKLFVRLDPPNPRIADQIEMVLDGGAEIVMLPYFRKAAEVERFVDLVGGRAFVIILVETAAAVAGLPEILRVPGVGEVMIGLNDLRLEMAIESHFELLASPLLDQIASKVREAGLPFSLGGVTRPGDKSLATPPDLVLAQYPRLGASGAWIARSFLHNNNPMQDFAESVGSIRQRLTEWAEASAEVRARARDDLMRHLRGTYSMPRYSARVRAL
jgi:citrate lyase beta subunit